MRKMRRFFKLHRRMNNHGFSLMELLVSIIILILIMVPLMNNFVRSAKINSEAEKLQDYSVTASNIVENMKSLELGTLLDTYGTDGLTFDGTDYAEENYSSSDIGQKVYYFGLEEPETGDPKYDVLVKVNADDYTPRNSFEMPDIATVDDKLNGMFLANVFQSIDTRMPVSTLEGMDDLYKNVDTATSMADIDYESFDRMALNFFWSQADNYADGLYLLNPGDKYAEYLADKQDYDEAVEKGLSPGPLPTAPDRTEDTGSAYSNPDYCQISNLLDYITRISEISISDYKDALDNKRKSIISYQVTYECKWPAGVSISTTTKTYQIQSVDYGLIIHNAYLYYQPSIFQQYYLTGAMTSGVTHEDKISIKNSAENEVDFYIVNMMEGINAYINRVTEVISNVVLNTNYLNYEGVDTTVPGPTVEININSDKLNIYTNLLHIIERKNVPGATDINKGKIVYSAAKNRIYSITVQLFEHTEDSTQKYKTKELYTLDSNRES